MTITENFQQLGKLILYCKKWQQQQIPFGTPKSAGVLTGGVFDNQQWSYHRSYFYLVASTNLVREQRDRDYEWKGGFLEEEDLPLIAYNCVERTV